MCAVCSWFLKEQMLTFSIKIQLVVSRRRTTTPTRWSPAGPCPRRSAGRPGSRASSPREATLITGLWTCFYHEMNVIGQWPWSRSYLGLNICYLFSSWYVFIVPIKGLSHIFHKMAVTGMSLCVYDDAPTAADILEYYSILSAVQGSWVQIQLDWCGSHKSCYQWSEKNKNLLY